MKRISYDSLDDNQIRAYAYMSSISPGGYSPGMEILPWAALLKGFAVQDVMAAALCGMQAGMRPEEVENTPVPQALRETVLAYVNGLEYVPRPLDVSHVEMTPAMNDIVERTAEAIHEGWREARAREGVTVKENPLMKPWAELMAEERASTLSTASSAVKALAAMGGVSAADLDFAQSRDEICATLDEHVHDVWAQDKVKAGARYGVERTKDHNGKDLTHPDLLPFDQLSESSKAYDHEINVVILDAIHKNGLVVEAQPSQALKDTESMMEGIRKEARVDAEVERVLEKVDGDLSRVPENEPVVVTRLVHDVANYKLSQIPSQTYPMPPREHLKYNPSTSIKGSAAEIGLAQNARPGYAFKRDVLLEKADGTFLGIVPAGTVPAVDSYGVDIKGIKGIGKLNSVDVKLAYLEAVHDMLTGHGVEVDPKARKDISLPIDVNNLLDEGLSRQLLSQARAEVRELQAQGFVITSDMKGESLTGALGELLIEDPSIQDAVLTMGNKGYRADYKAADKDIVVAIHKDRADAMYYDRKYSAERKAENGRETRSAAFYEQESARTEVANLFMGNLDRSIAPKEFLQERVESFAEALKRPLSKESMLMDSMPDIRDGQSKVAGEAFRRAAWMILTGCSYNTAVQMEQGHTLPVQLPQRAVNAIKEYRQQQYDYQHKGFVGKLFSRTPKVPEAAIKAISDKVADMERDWSHYVAIDRAFASTPGAETLLPDAGEYVKKIGERYADAMLEVMALVPDVPGGERIAENAMRLRKDASLGEDTAGQKKEPVRLREQSGGFVVRSEDVRVLREYGIPEDVIKTVITEGSADFKGMTHNRPSTETSPADPRLDVKTSMHLERTMDGRIVVKDPVGRDMKVGDFLKMGYRDLLAKKPKKTEVKEVVVERKGPKVK